MLIEEINMLINNYVFRFVNVVKNKTVSHNINTCKQSDVLYNSLKALVAADRHTGTINTFSFAGNVE